MPRLCSGGPGSADGLVQWRPGPWMIWIGRRGHSSSGARAHAMIASHGHTTSAQHESPPAVQADRPAPHGRSLSGGGRRAEALPTAQRLGRSGAERWPGPGSIPPTGARLGGAMRRPPRGSTTVPRAPRSVRCDGLAIARRPGSMRRSIRGPCARAAVARRGRMSALRQALDDDLVRRQAMGCKWHEATGGCRTWSRAASGTGPCS